MGARSRLAPDEKKPLGAALEVAEEVDVAIRHACFVSYCHGQGELMQRFVGELVQALVSSIEPYVDVTGGPAELVYHDAQRLRPGYLYNEALAEAICQSVCMVAVFVPKYLDHEYCRRELEAMKRVEGERRRILGPAAPRHHGYIIPVVLRGEVKDLPPAIKGHVHCCDFSGFTTADIRLARQRRCMKEIEKIAKFVHELHRDVESMTLDCSTFTLPPASESSSWQPPAPSNSNPQPLREAGR